MPSHAELNELLYSKNKSNYLSPDNSFIQNYHIGEKNIQHLLIVGNIIQKKSEFYDFCSKYMTITKLNNFFNSVNFHSVMTNTCISNFAYSKKRVDSSNYKYTISLIKPYEKASNILTKEIFEKYHDKMTVNNNFITILMILFSTVHSPLYRGYDLSKSKIIGKSDWHSLVTISPIIDSNIYSSNKNLNEKAEKYITDFHENFKELNKKISNNISKMEKNSDFKGVKKFNIFTNIATGYHVSFDETPALRIYMIGESIDGIAVPYINGSHLAPLSLIINNEKKYDNSGRQIFSTTINRKKIYFSFISNFNSIKLDSSIGSEPFMINFNGKDKYTLDSLNDFISFHIEKYLESKDFSYLKNFYDFIIETNIVSAIKSLLKSYMVKLAINTDYTDVLEYEKIIKTICLIENFGVISRKDRHQRDISLSEIFSLKNHIFNKALIKYYVLHNKYFYTHYHLLELSLEYAIYSNDMEIYEMIKPYLIGKYYKKYYKASKYSTNFFNKKNIKKYDVLNRFIIDYNNFLYEKTGIENITYLINTPDFTYITEEDFDINSLHYRFVPLIRSIILYGLSIDHIKKLLDLTND